MPYFDNNVKISPATSTTNVVIPPNAGTIDLTLQASDTSTNTLEIKNSSGTSVSAFDSAGKLGIGNTAPSTRLHISGSEAQPSLTIDRGPGQADQNIVIKTPGSGVPGEVSANYGLKLSTGSNGDITLIPDGTGKVGISNSSPGALLDIGTATSTLGTMRLEGSTSGYVQIQPPVAAGSWTMTLPNSGGTNGYVLSTNGSGVTSWAAHGPTISTQVFTGSGTYTPTSGISYAIVEVVGGGGGGGGVVTASSSNNGTIGSGGGGGGYSRKVVSAATIGASQTVTIGAGGTAGANTGGTGGTGGTSSFGAIVTASGGVGGTGMNAQVSLASTGICAAGGAGGIGSSGDFNISGTCGGVSYGTTPRVGYSGRGGTSIYGGCGMENVFASTQGAAAGANGLTYGGGASGAYSVSTGGSPGANAGGVGAAGIVIITEFK